MNITFDPAKDAANVAKHGVSLSLAVGFDWATALVWRDTRKDYGELRQSALVMMEDRVFFVAFV